MASPPSNSRIRVLIGILCLIWGSTWLVIKVGLEDLPPVLSVGVRFLIAAGVMTIVAPFLRRVEGGEPPPLWLTIMVAFTQFSISYAIVYLCEDHLPSGLTSLLWAVFPLMMAVGGHFWLQQEKSTWRHAGGFVLGFVGVGLLFYTDIPKLGAGALPAALVLLLSPLICAVGTVVLKRHGAKVSSALLNRNSLWIGALLLLLYSFLTESWNEARWTPQAWFSIAYLSLIGTCVTFATYFWLLRHTAATRLSLIAYATPCIALALGWLILGEQIYWHTLAGTVLVVLGIAVVVRR